MGKTEKTSQVKEVKGLRRLFDIQVEMLNGQLGSSAEWRNH